MVSDDNGFVPARPTPKGKKPAPSTLVSRNVSLDGRRTSVRLEPSMWNGLADICKRERATLHQVCSAVARHKPRLTSFTAAVRVFILCYYRDAATEDGHAKCGHGQGPSISAVSLLVQSILNPGSMPYPLPSPFIIGKPFVPTRQ